MSTQQLSTTKATSLKSLLSQDVIRDQIGRALPRHLTPDRFLRVAMTTLIRTPKLSECSQESFMKCLLDLSALGIEPDGRRAHLIPYGKECTLILDYKGLAELAMRSGIIAKLHADVVCEHDSFEYNLGDIVQHKIDFRRSRGEVYAAYALAQTKDGPTFVQVLSKDEIEKVRSRSHAGKSGPWVTDWNEMAKKTAFRRLSKWLPLSAEFRDAVDREDLVEEREAQMRVVETAPRNRNLTQGDTESDGAETPPVTETPPRRGRPPGSGNTPPPQREQPQEPTGEPGDAGPASPCDAIQAAMHADGITFAELVAVGQQVKIIKGAILPQELKDIPENKLSQLLEAWADVKSMVAQMREKNQPQEG